ncbi:hypothetical protein KKP04_14825 [Rhodomicrobium sp. Az07]|uniref:hypothetical protein n=1 Tax=Rhodomicrobium sp. Az07 TaxID=2839034 RepID=UPI001BEC5197|nr:hypothetical protein [Rhodomicrobium sp. Az07]MBT3072127.1 hypothetical protein [Rhodomicrobium sp. Az07]
MFLIKPLEAETEDLELVWLAGLQLHPEIGWQVRMVTKGIVTGTMKVWPLNIGLLPILAPGRRFSQGRLLETSARGEIEKATIPNLAEGEEVGSDIIPAELYSFGGRQGGVQRLFQYEIGRTEYLIPAIELIRFLFVHNKTLANALMHPGGLMTLFSPEEPGIYEDLHLRFTREVPVSCLNRAFVREFAWLAVHPDGRKAWDSVYKQSRDQRYVSFSPPPLRNFRLTFRGVQWNNRWLVLEILQASGKAAPCRKLLYSHSSLRRVHYAKPDPTRAEPEGNGEKCQREYAIDGPVTGSRTDIRQRSLRVPPKDSGFDVEVPVEKVIWRELRQGVPDGARSGRSRAKAVGEDRADSTLVKRFDASLAEEALGASLPPIEFRVLERASMGHLGELEPLMKAIRLIAKLRPKLEVSMSLCYLKPGRSFSVAGRHRRVCLVAIFAAPRRAPVVLLDVDHSGVNGLASLLIRYRRPRRFGDIERDVRGLLDALVERNGRWNGEKEKTLEAVAECERLPKVLRCRSPKVRVEYLTAWAMRLLERIDFSAQR